MSKLLSELTHKKASHQKSLAVLIDPDKATDLQKVIHLVNLCVESEVDYILVGGSLITSDDFSKVVNTIKSHGDIPLIIFPGNHIQIDENADAIFLLSLISGRNPDFLIGQHVLAAPRLKRSQLDILPVGYMLVDSGAVTAASYMSYTVPLPSKSPDIAASTAMAGELLGLKAIYLDAGSGAQKPVPQKIISAVSQAVPLPLIVGGGLDGVDKINRALQAGADLVVIGNALEKDEKLLIAASRLMR